MPNGKIQNDLKTKKIIQKIGRKKVASVKKFSICFSKILIQRNQPFCFDVKYPNNKFKYIILNSDEP